MAVKPRTIRRVNRRVRPPFLSRARAFMGRRGRMILVAAGVSAAGIGGYMGYCELMTSPYLAVTGITVDGAKRLSEDEIIAESGIEEGCNLFSFSAGDAAEAVKRLAWVVQAQVRRTGLDTVRIEIKEREPVALVRFERPGAPDRLRIMDSAGVVFAEYSHEDALDLPVVTGVIEGWEGRDDGGEWSAPAVMRLIAFLKQRKGFNINDVSEIHADGVFGLTVYTLNDGVRLNVGTGGFEEKFAAFDRIVASRGGTLSGIEAMDLINPGEVVVKFTTNMV
ncbi:MAG: FtsQ-type POTRA domain-containing protein [Deltaproteobacteria bacterium]|nr:FtsQ-type POTRA domain-containing protein [Deltaproteobacteria bacterium]